MKTITRKLVLSLFAAAAIAGGATIASAPANAQVYVGVGPGWHHHHRWGWHRHWGPGGCRVVVRRFWHHGHPVVVRRRECV